MKHASKKQEVNIKAYIYIEKKEKEKKQEGSLEEKVQFIMISHHWECKVSTENEYSNRSYKSFFGFLMIPPLIYLKLI